MISCFKFKSSLSCFGKTSDDFFVSNSSQAFFLGRLAMTLTFSNSSFLEKTSDDFDVSISIFSRRLERISAFQIYPLRRLQTSDDFYL